MKILAVDDNPTNLEILKVLLRSTGFPILEASNGRQALELARTEQPDLVFMDLAMPGEFDGFEATRRIKGLPETAHIVVVAITAMVMRSDLSEALAAGCSDFVRKPYTRKELLGIIQKYFPGSVMSKQPPRLSHP
jgi:CheY-like chemotaxis protein